MTARDVLVTGATGKTGRRVVDQLVAKGHGVRAASRSGDGPGSVRFDWTAPATFAAGDGVDAAYLLAPSGVSDLLPAMRPLIDRLITADVGRLVLLSASSLEPGGPMMGAVHGYLVDNAPRWTVLRPSWFMQNFSEQQHRTTIRDEGTIYSATGDGGVGFVSADDVAAVAAQALTDRDAPNRDLVLTGPQALSYDEVARLIGEALGKPIRHHRLGVEDLAARFEAQGLPPEYASVLAGLDAATAQGAEAYVTATVMEMTGEPSTAFATFASAARSAWI